MPTDIAKTVAARLGYTPSRVKAVLDLLADGATIPFIARYRKEVTGSLDEVAILAIKTAADSVQELADRKEYVTNVITSLGKLTPELEKAIEAAEDMAAVEDLYLPYKPKRRTRAQMARERGLEPLAERILDQRNDFNPAEAKKFVTSEVKDVDEALAGASDIIAEKVSENIEARNDVRGRFKRTAKITSKVVKSKEQDAVKYADYYEFTEPLNRCSSHRYLAMRRGENEGMLRVSIEIDNDEAVERLTRRFVRNRTQGRHRDILEDAVADGYSRLLRPSIENEVASATRTDADRVAIEAFADNLRQLLMAPPLGPKRVMGVDPGYRTGCKVVVIDESGSLLHHDVIYPTPPHNDREGAGETVLNLVKKYGVEAIAVGNGTAGRETEQFLRRLRYPHEVSVNVVNENGASVYSASAIAREEFPNEDVTVRGAVSIARRLVDPLAELVKIDPKSIGVGQYQHDVDQTALKASLDYTVEACVNNVGVNLNTASARLLSYVSGIGDTIAKNIVDYRAQNGPFTSRKQLMKVPRLGAKAFEQCAGFLRIPEAENLLDNTAVHPERYEIVERIAKDLGCTVKELVADKDRLHKLDLNRYVTDECGLPTLKDIVKELEKPGRDPRQTFSEFKFDETVHSIDDLRAGMVLPGIVNNITDFGAFVDIGVHQSGLVHKSQMAMKRVNNPREVVKLNQHVMVKVLDVDTNKQRISLSMKEVPQDAE